jgi:hypothetical protein
MTSRKTLFYFIIVAAVASCSGQEDSALQEGAPNPLVEDDALASWSQALTKGTVGAVNGDQDYCGISPNQCVSGEGDCDSNASCSSGTSCLPNNGAKFGFPSVWDVCAPLHCNNKVLDAGAGETGVDCGGPCGACLVNCSGTPGGKDFCVGCLCASGAGDCDDDVECQPGLVCGAQNGPNFGLPANFDVCVPQLCTNGVQDAGNGETGVDIGGPCGTAGGACSGTAGTPTFCVGCKCTSGQGDCDGDIECATGLVCANDNGANFGLQRGIDVCVPPHCTNGVQDAGQGETGVDVGGPCSSGGVTPPPSTIVFFSEYVEGSGFQRAFEVYNAGASAVTGCEIRIYFNGGTTASETIALPSIASHALNVTCDVDSHFPSPPCNHYDFLDNTGDDAVALYCNNVLYDVIGQIGFDPGSEWGTGLISTQDNTIRRKCSVTTGDINPSDAWVPSLEWDGFANNNRSDLASRSCN